MDKSSNHIKTEIYNKCSLEVSSFKLEKESKEYDACQFDLSGRKIISRSAKITPKKVGQFVTLWKRNKNQTTEPFRHTDQIDFFLVNVHSGKQAGQFVFPKTALIQKGIITTEKKEGKRGFRVYPSWDIPKSKQAIATQKWQLDYFYLITESTNLNKVIELYQKQ